MKYRKTLTAYGFESSPPSRGRGLKYAVAVVGNLHRTVAPLAGAWIEMLIS